MDEARRTELQVEISGADVTSDVAKRFISCTFTDEEDGSSDDFELELEDSDNQFIKSWLTTEVENRPTVNVNGGSKATIVPVLVQKNYNDNGKNLTLACGNFEIDEVDMEGPPQTVTLHGTSLAYTTGMRNVCHFTAWENTTLLRIAQKIAKAGGYNVMYLTDKTVKYTRKEQSGMTDIAFLQKLCTTAGLSVKVTNGTICIYDQKEYESKTSVRTITRGDKSYISYSFTMKLADSCYAACTVTYTDDEGNEYEGTYIPEDSEYTTTTVKTGSSGTAVKTLQKYLVQLGYSVGSSGVDGVFGSATYSAVISFQSDQGLTQDGICGEKTWEALWDAIGTGILEVTDERVTSNSEAKELAMAKLRQANKGEKTATFTLPGDLTLCAGLTVTTVGFGDYDGKYIIEQGKHTLSKSSGYKLTIKLREVITSY